MLIPGQRVVAQSEPELGLGIIVEVEEGTIDVLFPGSEVQRRYSVRTAPLRRLVLAVGQRAATKEGKRFTVEKIIEEGGLYRYKGKGVNILESDLHHQVEDLGAIDQFLTGDWSPRRTYDLRKEGWRLRAENLSPDVRGIAGCRVSLLPHQLYVARSVSKREMPRVLLADEVGLGKTIEAGLVFASLRALGRASRVLVVVPEALKNQWLVEMYRRFNEMFTLLDERRAADEEKTTGESVFLSARRVICSFEFLMGNPERLSEATAENWDLLIIDEAHHLGWDVEEPDAEWVAAKLLSDHARGLLLLTATPRQQGLETQFGLLHLVDPDRFDNFEEYREQAGHMKESAQLARQLHDGKATKKVLDELAGLFPEDEDLLKSIEKVRKGKNKAKEAPHLLRSLIDRHGTGRVLIRNRRERLQGFPERKLIASPMKATKEWIEELKSFDAEDIDELTMLYLATGRPPHTLASRGKWLREFLENLGDEKVLLICTAPEVVRALDRWLHKKTGMKRACFHEEMEIIERDRQAAWFADPEGPQILLCSEIGGEGRNFQFAHKLIIFDLPPHPDLLEQRIGRLDRIGQEHEIEIYVPFVEGTPEEVLFSWYAYGLESFTHAWNGGTPLLDALQDDIIACCRHYIPGAKSYEGRDAQLKKLIEKTKKMAAEVLEQERESVDTLVDLNSFDEDEGNRLAGEIAELDADPRLKDYFEALLDHFGIGHERHDADVVRLRTTAQSYVDSLPDLPPHSKRLATYKREVALRREELAFLTTDNPMVEEAMSYLLDRNEGRASIAQWVGSPQKSGMRLQLLYILEPTAPPALEAERYLPVQPIEVVLDHQGNMIGSEEEEIKRKSLSAMPEHEVASQLEALQEFLPPLIEKAHDHVAKLAQPAIKKAVKDAKARMEEEQDRLVELHRVNPMMPEAEIVAHKEKMRATLAVLKDAEPRLDAVRMVFLR